MLREHLEKLYPFSVVARLQSFRKASQALRVTQPALTRTVQALERDLGVELFKRHKQRIHITSEGERLLALASRLLHETEDAEGLLRSTGSALAGKLRLGTFESLSVRVLPKVMCQLARTYPQLSFSITSSGTEEIADALARGELDFGFAGGPRPRAWVSCLSRSYGITFRFTLRCGCGSGVRLWKGTLWLMSPMPRSARARPYGIT